MNQALKSYNILPYRLASQILVLSLVAMPMASNADTIFKCKGPNGALLYQNTKCEKTEEVGKWNAKAYIPPAPNSQTTSYYAIAKKGAGGVFRLDGEINGVPANMVIDTGAAFLSIPSQMADQFSLEKGTHSLKLMSANGIVQAYNTTVKKLKLGNLVINNVTAVISPNTAGILLGQSVLGLLKVEQSKEELRLSVSQ